MKRPDPTEQALERLSSLRTQAGGTSTAAQEIKGFLKNRSHVVVAKAAKLAGELHMNELSPELVAAFHRLMENPAKRDKGCTATTEIVTVLYELDYVEPEIYLMGIHHVQMEGSFGLPVDAAARLRGMSALGLARTRFPEALNEIVTLLVDPWTDARVGAVRALAANGGDAGALLLKLKILTGDRESDVLAECFTGLLETAPERSLVLVANYIDSEDLAVAEAALLALGSSHHPQALQLLKQRWETLAGGPLRKTLVLSIAMIRSEEAIAFLVSVLETCATRAASDVIAALAIFRESEKVRTSVEAAVSRRNDQALSEAFRVSF